MKLRGLELEEKIMQNFQSNNTEIISKILE